MDNLDTDVSDVINVVIILSKYFIHTYKWKNTTPLFPVFLNYCVDYFKSLKYVSNLNKKNAMIYQNIAKSLLF